MPSKSTPRRKPALRGVSHAVAAGAAAGAGTMLTFEASSPVARWGCAIYTLTLTAMFTISSIYHMPTWSLSRRSFMRKLDHSGIYGIIAGTYTPLCLLALDHNPGMHLLKLVWTGATIGIIQSVLSKGGSGYSKVISAVLYVALGWIVLPYTGQLQEMLGGNAVALVAAGGVVYSLGAVVYAARWPDPFPTTFGYHEIFHALVILAALLHFIAVRIVVLSHSPVV